MSSDESDSETLQNMSKQTKQRYIIAYENFMTWRKDRNTDSFSEELLLEYFEEMALKYKPSTMWAMYSMLKYGLKSNHDVNIKRYERLSALLRKWNKGYVCKKVQALSMENIEKFIDEAPDDRHLATKVALILGVSGGLRIQDLLDLTTNDIENHGEVFVVKINTDNRLHSSFVLHGKYYEIVKKYQNLRVKKAASKRFLQQFRNGRCMAQVIGKNKFGAMSKEITEFLNLPCHANAFTGRVRKTAPDHTRRPERCIVDLNGKKQLKTDRTGLESGIFFELILKHTLHIIVLTMGTFYISKFNVHINNFRDFTSLQDFII